MISLFPLTLTFFYNSGDFEDDIAFTLCAKKYEPLYTCNVELDLLQRPKLTLHSAIHKSSPPLAAVKSKGLKDSLIKLTPPSGSGYPHVEEKLKVHYGLSSRTFSFNAPVGNGRTEKFA